MKTRGFLFYAAISVGIFALVVCALVGVARWRFAHDPYRQARRLDRLAEYGQLDSRDFPALAALCEDPDPDVRKSALWGVTGAAKYDPALRPAVRQILTAHLADPSPERRVTARKMLGHLSRYGGKDEL